MATLRRSLARWWWLPLPAAAVGAVAGLASWATARELTVPADRPPASNRASAWLHQLVWDTRTVQFLEADRPLGLEGARVHLKGPRATSPGLWGLTFGDGGYLQLGPPQLEADGTAWRDAIRVGVDDPFPGDVAVLDAHLFPGRLDQAGMRGTEVLLEGSTGQLPAWWFEPQQPDPALWDEVAPLPVYDPEGAGKDAWLISVHGRWSPRSQPLRYGRIAAASGWNVLNVAYRNDPWASPSSSGRSSLGLDEWEDLEAPVRFALDQGAKRIMLFGFSMGGALTTMFLRRSELAAHIDQVALDAPVLDWQAVLTHVLTGRRLPEVLATTSLGLLRWRSKLDWQALTQLSSPDTFSRPVLLIQGDEDRVVPIEGADRFASERPDLVTYVRVAGGAHVASFNVAPGRVTDAFVRFLT